MNVFRRAELLLGGILVTFFAAAIAAEDAPSGDRKTKAPSTLRELMDAAIDDVQVFADAETKTAARPLVVMRWANNARGSEDGSTVLYIHDGRPLAVACLYPWTGQVSQDFSCVARERIVARRNGAVIWRPQELGVEFADIPDAPAPESSRPQRLRQMKSLAGQFQSTMLGWKADDSDREELRLLPRPLYRYEPVGGNVLDGAVFAFVMGTDPESLLLIEAFETGGGARWQFAFVRRTSGELEGRYRDKVVWHAERFPEMRNTSKPDFSVGFPLPPELMPKNDKR